MAGSATTHVARLISGRRVADNVPGALRKLLHLELTLEDPRAEERELRMALKRVTSFVRDVPREEFVAQLGALEVRDVSKQEIADVVHGLFPERVQAEKAFVEEASLLDFESARAGARIKW